MITCLNAAVCLSAGTVILTVLKWILLILMWTVIGILGLALLMVLILLFTPLFYHVDASKQGEDIKAKGKAGWLLNLVRVRVSFQDKKLVWSLKVGPKQLAGSEAAEKKDRKEKKDHKRKKKDRFYQHGSLEEEALEKEVLEEEVLEEEVLEEEEVPQEEKEKAAAPLSQTKEEVVFQEPPAEEPPAEPPAAEPEPFKAQKPEPIASAHVEAVPGRENPIRAAERMAADAQKKLIQKEEERRQKAKKRQQQKQLQKEKKQQQKQLKKEKKQQEKEAAGKKASGKAKKPRPTLADIESKILDLLGKGLDLALDLLDLVLDAPDKIQDFVEEKTEPIRPYLTAWENFPDKEATGKDLALLVKRILRALFFKHIRADAVFGTGDPASTGKILGYYDFLSPLLFPKQTRRDHISLEADFDRKIIDFTLTGSGHFCLWTLLVWPGLRALASKRVSLVIKTVRRMIKQKKQSTNQKETDDVTSQYE